MHGLMREGRREPALYSTSWHVPSWFKVETPIGTYNPDWAIVKEDDQKVYLVRETKGTKDQFKLRGSEWAKIQCGKAHFEEISVDYDWIEKASDV